MAEKVTYYAILDEFSTREKPSGVLRRVENDEGATDEIFCRDLSWEFSSLLIAAERSSRYSTSPRSARRKPTGSWHGSRRSWHGSGN
jgi:hypothetical protein